MNIVYMNQVIKNSSKKGGDSKAKFKHINCLSSQWHMHRVCNTFKIWIPIDNGGIKNRQNTSSTRRCQRQGGEVLYDYISVFCDFVVENSLKTYIRSTFAQIFHSRIFFMHFIFLIILLHLLFKQRGSMQAPIKPA